MLLRARRICRGLGLTVRTAIRRGDTTVALRFDDGSVVGIRPDIVLLKRRSTAPAPVARTFTRALARGKRWVISRDDTAWPPPRAGGPAIALAGTQAALRSHMALRLRGHKHVYFAEGPCLSQDAAALWGDIEEPGPDMKEQTGTPLTLTPQRLRALLAPELGSVERVEALTERHREISVAAFLKQDGVPRLLSKNRLNGIIRSRLRKMQIASEVDSGC